MRQVTRIQVKRVRVVTERIIVKDDDTFCFLLIKLGLGTGKVRDR